MPSWPGASSACASASGERTRNVVSGGTPLSGSRVVPSQKATRKGRWGRARASSSRRAVGRERGTRGNLPSAYTRPMLKENEAAPAAAQSPAALPAGPEFVQPVEREWLDPLAARARRVGAVFSPA